MFNDRYFIEDAIRDAARAAYVATLLQTGHTTIEKYDGNPVSVDSLDMSVALPAGLNRLKRTSPEAYFYWAKIGSLMV